MNTVHRGASPSKPAPLLRAAIVVLALLPLLAMGLPPSQSEAAAALSHGSDSEATLFGTMVPERPSVDDPGSVELGVIFESKVAGEVTGIRFYKGSGNSGQHVGRLWSIRGEELASVTFINEAAAGWQTALFSEPVPVTAGEEYVASYWAPAGQYAEDVGFFASPRSSGPLTALGSAYHYGSGGIFPRDTWMQANYWVDVLFREEPTVGEAETLFADSTPRVAVHPDPSPVELGVKVKVRTAGTVTGLRFYKGGPENAGPHVGSLWSSTGQLLRRVTYEDESASGWQEARIVPPLPVDPGEVFTASYFAPSGHYAATVDAFSHPWTAGSFSVDPGAGVYRYGSTGFPSAVHRNLNYWVDLTYQPEVTHTPTPPAATTPKPTPTSPPAAGWLVNASTVGLAPLGLSCDSLPVYTGPSKVARGAVITNVRVTTPLDLSAGGITVQRSCIQPTSVGKGMPVIATTDYNTFAIATEKVVVRDSDIDGSKLTRELAAYATGFLGIADMIGNYVHGFGGGIAIFIAGESLDSLIERNYVTGLVAWGDGATTGNHSDAFTVRDFPVSTRPDRELVIRNNRFDCHSGNDTGALFIQAWAGHIANVTIQGNYLEGMGYQLGLEAHDNGYSNVRAVNNRFSGTGWGAAYVSGGPGWAEWHDNYLYDPAGADGRGKAIPKP